MANDRLTKLTNRIIPVLVKHQVQRAGLFGSVLRSDYSEKSDIDIVIEPAENISLLDFIGIKIDLEKKLGNRVDLVQYRSIHPRLKRYILPTEYRFYDQQAR